MTESNITIRIANHLAGRSGRQILQEVYTFAETAHQTEPTSLFDPLSILGPERLLRCDEAFVAELNGRVVGAVTLAFKGVFGPEKPTLDGLYVLPKYRGKGISCRLIAQALQRLIELEMTPVLCIAESKEMVMAIGSFRRKHPELSQHIYVRCDDLAGETE